MLQRNLPAFLKRLPWFAKHPRKLEIARIVDDVRLAHRHEVYRLLLVQVEYGEGSVETYALPLTFAGGEAAQRVLERCPQAVAAHLKIAGKGEGVLYDALGDEAFASALLRAILRRRRYAGGESELVASTRHVLQAILDSSPRDIAARILKGQERRVFAIFDDKLFLKIYRRLESSVHPDLEVGRFLTDRGFPHAPATAGALEIQRPGQEPMTLAVLRQYVPHDKTAWQYTLDALGSYFERALARVNVNPLPLPCNDLVSCARHDNPPLTREVFEFYLDQAALLGRRAAELHLALASDSEDSAFAPEPFTGFFQRSQFQVLHHLRTQVFQRLRGQLNQLPESVRGEAQAVLGLEPAVRERLRAIRERKFQSLRIRCHGNFHLGQVLYTGKDFVITDFRGDPRQSLSERRGKYSPLRDVAAMLRSFHHAGFASLQAEAEGTLPAGLVQLEPWYRFYLGWVPANFLKGYLEAIANTPLLPPTEDELRALLEIHSLEESLVELGYELEHRPNWVKVALEAILQLFQPVAQSG